MRTAVVTPIGTTEPPRRRRRGPTRRAPPGPGRGPRPRTRRAWPRRALPRGARTRHRRRPPYAVSGEYDGAARQQQQVDQVGRRQGRLGPQRAGEQHAEARERRRAEQDARGPGRRTLMSGDQPSSRPATPITRNCSTSTHSSAPILPPSSAPRDSGSGAEPLEDAVPALEAGRDRQRRERRRHHGQREHAGRQDVDRRVRGVEVQPRCAPGRRRPGPAAGSRRRAAAARRCAAAAGPPSPPGPGPAGPAARRPAPGRRSPVLTRSSPVR